MSGFIRRYSNMPGAEVLGAIEGVVVIDAPPPGSVQGAGVGTAAIVAEFADLTYAVEANNVGELATKPQPTEVFGTQEILEKFGGWDPTLGDFGVSGGNGFAELKGKRFSRLVLVGVNLASGHGVRLTRELPTNRDATTPEPTVALVAATVQAATEFKSGTSRVKHGARFTFKDTAAFKSGIDGEVTAVAGAATAGYVESADGPFDFRGLGANQLQAQFEAGGAQNFNITKGPAVRAGGAATYPLTADITLDVNDGPAQVISIVAAADAAATVAQINGQIFDGKAVVNGLNFDIKSDRQGTSAKVDITAVNNSVGVSGHTVGTANGTGNVANEGAVTAAELAAGACAGITDGTATAVGQKLRFTSATTGVLSTATVNVGSTADVAMGGQFATNAVGTGTAAGAGGGTALAFTSATGDFQNPDSLVRKGDALVLGVIDAAGAQGDNAGTFRVRSVVSATQLLLEQQDGSAFNWTTGAALAWRIHTAAVADSGGEHAVDEGGGYVLPARPIDATIVAATSIAPTNPAPAATADTWTPTAGLALRTHPTGGLVYTASVQAPNAPAHAALDALYAAAFDALGLDKLPAAEVNLVHAARTSSSIRSNLRAATLSFVGQGVGRCAIVWPELNTAGSPVLGDTSPGVGATRDERVFYAWPHALLEVTEATNTPIMGADGRRYDNGLLDMPAAGLLLSGLSQLAPERNPGQASDPMKTVMSIVKGFARGTPDLTMDHYIQMRAKGIVGMRQDRRAGFIFQSGVTTSLESGRKNINRRRFADFIQDSVSARLVQWAKEPMTEAFKAGTVQEVINFFDELLSPNNSAAQRIVAYDVDDVSGNTEAMEAKGIWVIIGKVRSLATGDVIVFQSEVGEGVVITRAQ